MKGSLILFSRASSTHAKLSITYRGGINSHAHTCYSYPSGWSLRKHIMRAHRWWSFLTLQCREVQGYVNGSTGFGNMCFVTIFCLKSWSRYRLCPYEHLNRMAGREWGTACGPSHRPSRSKKKHWYFLTFSRLHSTTVSEWKLALDSALERG